MNLGKSYKKEPVSDEQRLNEVENKFSVILERIQAYDKVLDEFKEIKNQLASLKQLHHELSESLRKFDSFHSTQYLGLNSLLISLTKRIDKEEKDKKCLEEKINSNKQTCNASLSELTNSLEESKANFNKMKAQFCLISDLNNLEKKIIVKEETFISILKSHETDHDNLHLKVGIAINKISDIEKKLSSANLESIQSNVNEALKKNKDEIETSLVHCLSRVTNNLIENKDHIEKQMANTRDILLGTPSGIENVKKDIMNKLEMTALEASNATIKTGNTQKKIDLLEKKIEMVLLLLQKNDIK